MSNLNDLAREIHVAAIDKGFYDEPTTIGERLMRTVGELSEAHDAHRKEEFACRDCFEMDADSDCFDDLNPTNNWIKAFEYHIKDTFEDEIADAIMYLLDLAACHNIDIEYFIRTKMRYNSTRPRLHGKAY